MRGHHLFLAVDSFCKYLCITRTSFTNPCNRASSVKDWFFYWCWRFDHLALFKHVACEVTRVKRVFVNICLYSESVDWTFFHSCHTTRCMRFSIDTNGVILVFDSETASYSWIVLIHFHSRLSLHNKRSCTFEKGFINIHTVRCLLLFCLIFLSHLELESHGCACSSDWRNKTVHRKFFHHFTKLVTEGC